MHLPKLTGLIPQTGLTLPIIEEEIIKMKYENIKKN